MFKCVKCTKPTTTDEWEEEKAEGGGNVSWKPKEASKSITRQLKGIVLKLRGINKLQQRKPSSGSASHQKRHHKDSGAVSDHDDAPPFPYVEGGSSGSTPKWEFTTFNHQLGSTNTGCFPMAFVGIPTATGSDEYYSATSSVVEEEWMVEVEEGITIIFASLPSGGYDIRKIRFSQEMFDKNLAQMWWYHNYKRVREIYNVVSLNGQAIYTPDDVFGEISETMLIFEEEEGSTSQLNPPLNQSYESLDLVAGGGGHNFNVAATGSLSGIIAPPTSLATTPGSSQRNTNNPPEAEWVEEDEPGVFLTIRQSADGVREIIRLRFSRKKFDVDGAKNWFVDNKERVEAQYL